MALNMNDTANLLNTTARVGIPTTLTNIVDHDITRFMDTLSLEPGDTAVATLAIADAVAWMVPTALLPGTPAEWYHMARAANDVPVANIITAAYIDTLPAAVDPLKRTLPLFLQHVSWQECGHFQWQAAIR